MLLTEDPWELYSYSCNKQIGNSTEQHYPCSVNYQRTALPFIAPSAVWMGIIFKIYTFLDILKANFDDKSTRKKLYKCNAHF